MINFRRYAIFVQCFSRSFSLNETMTIDTKILVVDLERNGSPEVKINHFKWSFWHANRHAKMNQTNSENIHFSSY